MYICAEGIHIENIECRLINTPQMDIYRLKNRGFLKYLRNGVKA